jgi:hypothetical protein
MFEKHRIVHFSSWPKKHALPGYVDTYAIPSEQVKRIEELIQHKRKQV